jgi:hypothetical protein
MYEITTEEIEIERTPSEVYEWVFSTFENFKTKEEVTSLRLLTYRAIKVFIEESYPLAYFCNHFFSEESSVKINQKVGDQPYDVIVEGCDKFNYIEITNAINGYDERLRNEELDRTGSVPGAGEVIVTGTKASGKQTVIFENIAVLHDGIKEEQKELILEIVRKKSQKNYPVNTMLIVGFPDNPSFKTDEDISELESFMHDKLSPIVSNFAGLSLVGFSGKVFLLI